ncbi:unnamed protein product [Calypogeia fissa]
MPDSTSGRWSRQTSGPGSAIIVPAGEARDLPDRTHHPSSSWLPHIIPSSHSLAHKGLPAKPVAVGTTGTLEVGLRELLKSPKRVGHLGSDWHPPRAARGHDV